MATISGTLRLNDAFSNVLNKFNSGIQRSVVASDRLKSSLNSGSNGINSLGNSANKANVGLRQIIAGSAFGSMISKAASSATNGMRAFVGELNESTVAWSTFEGNMRQMGKSPAEINAAKKSLQKFAQDTIYSSSDMASTYSQLAAVGTKNTTQLVKGFGGLAAAATDPKQAMKTLSQQATQMAAKPTVQWQDFKLMLEQTPAGMAAVAKSMGMSTRQLVKNVQDGTIKTEQFLNAIAKTGTNANFSKMATQYKTVGQALDGLKETLANKVQPQFKKLSDIVIKVITKITDKLGKVNFKKFADKLIDDINRIKKGISSFAKGFSSEFGMTQFKQTAHDISESFKTLFEGLSKGSGKNPLANLGKGVGKFVLQMANGLSNLATAISQMDPSAIKALGVAFLALKFGTTGLKLVAVAAGLKIISKLSPGQLQHLATAITALATAFIVLKSAAAILNTASGIINFFSKIKDVIGNLITFFTTTLPLVFSGIGDAITAALGPIGLVIAGITILIVGAIYAWQTNLSNFRDNMQNLFSNFGEIFEPLRSAFSDLGEALSPASGALSAIGKVIGSISIVAIYGIALGVGALADALRSIISIATAFVYSLRAAGDAIRAVGSAFNDIRHGDFSFSGMRKAFADTGDDIKHMFDSFGQVGEMKMTGGVIASLQGISKQAKTTKSDLENVKEPSILDKNAQVNNMGNVFKNKQMVAKGKAKITGYQFDTDPAKLSKLKNTTIKAKVKPEVTSQDKVQKMIEKSAKPVKLKYATPKIPDAKAPKIKTLHAKVAKPKIPTPKAPKIKTLHAKVARPKVPTPKTPKVKAIARSGTGAMYSAGAMIGQGLASGMMSSLGAVTAAADALVHQADRAARAKAEVHSPSRLFARIGGFVGQGLAVGMNSTQGAIASASDAMVATATPDAMGIDYDANTNRSGKPGGLVNTRFGNTSTSNDNRSSTLTIESGAIQINSSGDSDEDFETLVGKFEDYLIAKSEKALS